VTQLLHPDGRVGWVEEITDVKNICRYIPALVLALGMIQSGLAQSTIDVNLGFGSGQAKANAGFDASSANFGLVCNSSTPAGSCLKTPAYGSFVMGGGANAMLWPKFGVGGEVNWQASKQTYANTTSTLGAVLQSRVTFYDFNGIYRPVNKEKVGVLLSGGVGGVNFRMYQNYSSGSLLGSSAYGSYPISSANHFQVHGGFGVQAYISGNLFIRPQFDIHYVPNFIQFGKNVVMRESVWLGYSFGERQ
jgi:hypothetical protein